MAGHLDNLPGGFTPSDTGTELRLLKRPFTPEKAELWVIGIYEFQVNKLNKEFVEDLNELPLLICDEMVRN